MYADFVFLFCHIYLSLIVYLAWIDKSGIINCWLFFSHRSRALKPRQYKNNSIWSNIKLDLKLPLFFTRLFGKWKSAANSKLIYFSIKWCRSNIVFSLVNAAKLSKIDLLIIPQISMKVLFLLYNYPNSFKSNHENALNTFIVFQC